jgi:hypothetical protein
MKYIFRGHIVFEYNPNSKLSKVVQHMVHDKIPAFDYCVWIVEDYKLLGEFFDKVYRHQKGEEVDLKDFEVY